MPGSQKFSQNFHWKILWNFLMVFDVSLEMQSDSKNYVSAQDDLVTKLVHTIKSACAWHLENIRLHRQLEIFHELLQKASVKPNEKMRCLFGKARQFYKLLAILRRQYHIILTASWDKIYSVLGGVAKRQSPIRNILSPNAVNMWYYRLKIVISFVSWSIIYKDKWNCKLINPRLIEASILPTCKTYPW